MNVTPYPIVERSSSHSGLRRRCFLLAVRVLNRGPVRSEKRSCNGVGGVTQREVRETYERIAAHFSRTRPEPWEEVSTFLDGRRGTTGLDIGTGNGRHAELLAAACRRVVGVDLSHASLEEAGRRAEVKEFDLELIAGEATEIPLCDRTVDLGIYVATLHHLPSRSLRVASLDELARVLKPTGHAIVSAWSVTHERFDAAIGFDTTVNWTLPDGEVVERFYHVYDAEEFIRDVDESALRPTSTFESHGNCYAVVAPEQ